MPDVVTLALMHSVCRPCCTTGFGSICDTAVLPVPPAVPSLRGLITTLRHTGGVLTPEPYFVEVDFEYHAEAYPRAVTLPGNPALYDADSHWPFAGFWRADCVVYGDDEAVGPFGTSDFRAVVTIALLPGPAIGGGGNRIGAVYVESFRAVVGGVAEPLGDALARCDAIRDQIFADDDGDWPEGSTHPVVQVTDCASLCFNGTAADPLDFLAALPGGASIRIGESDPFGPWDVSATACVTAKRPDCGETPGALLAGAAAELALIGPGGLTSIGGGVTDGSGRSCLPVTAPGLYQWTVTDADGCVATARFGVVPCQDDGATIETTAEPCCAVLRVPVIADEDDAPIEGAIVTVAGLDPATTDAGGFAEIAIPTDYMLALPTTEGDCGRPVTVVVTAPDLEPRRNYPRCQTFVMHCGDTAATARDPVRLGLFPDGLARSEAGVPGCPPPDCTLIYPDDAVTINADVTHIQEFFDIDGNPLLDDLGAPAGGFEWSGTATLDQSTDTDMDLVSDFDQLGAQVYRSPCIEHGDAARWPRYYNGISYQDYQSAKVTVEVCATDGAPRVVTEIFKAASCASDGNPPGGFPGDNDIRTVTSLGSGTTLCHLDTIADSGTVGGGGSAGYDWSLDMSPTEP